MGLARNVLGAFLVGLLAGCSSSVSQEPVLVGHIYLASPESPEATPMATRGAQLALEEACAAAKEGRRPGLTLLRVESPPEPSLLQAEAVRLLTLNRAVALLGSCSGARAEALLRGARSYEAPLVLAGSLDITSPREGLRILGASGRLRGEALAGYTLEKLEGKKIGVLLDERLRAPRALVAAFLEACRKEGKAEVLDWAYATESERSERLDRLIQAKPDVVLLGVAPGDMAPILTQLKMAEIKGPVLYGGEDVAFQELRAGSTDSPLYLVTAFAPEIEAEDTRSFVGRFQDRFGERPNLDAVLAFEGVHLLIKTLAQSHGPSPSQVKQALRSVQTLDGVTGELQLGETQVRRPLFIVEAAEGKVRVVHQASPGDS